MGFSSLKDFLVGFGKNPILDNRDANNLLAMLCTWQNGDAGKTPGFDGDTVATLASIQARAIQMPAEKDLYFPAKDEVWASQHLPNSEVRVIPGVWGHFAGGGKNPVDTTFIDKAVVELLGCGFINVSCSGPSRGIPSYPLPSHRPPSQQSTPTKDWNRRGDGVVERFPAALSWISPRHLSVLPPNWANQADRASRARVPSSPKPG